MKTIYLFFIAFIVGLSAGQKIYDGLFMYQDSNENEDILFVPGDITVEDISKNLLKGPISEAIGGRDCGQCMEYFCSNKPCKYNCDRYCGGYYYECPPKTKECKCNCNCKFDRTCPNLTCGNTTVNPPAPSSPSPSSCTITRVPISQGLGGFAARDDLVLFTGQVPSSSVFIPGSTPPTTRDLIGIVFNITVRVFGSTTITFDTGSTTSLGKTPAFIKTLRCPGSQGVCDISICQYDKFSSATLQPLASSHLLTLSTTNNASIVGTITTVSTGN